ncbi:nuclear transport factor 2 family protein [Shewanella indica]|uniref:nuclear transport factor 2 family protein n=1 Tax=Shewanella indica TaxID=768528 RepID=UPI001F354F00|nr:nuclear transport factor 2 family protein [Shewanella indica]
MLHLKPLLLTTALLAFYGHSALANNPQAGNQTGQEQSGQLDDSQTQAALVLDKLHQSAANADWDSYFSLFSPDAGFIGTDASEYWNMVEFEQYARATQGWTYQSSSRRLVQHGEVIVFDELLDSQSYGLGRGTGTLVKTEQGWQILQYSLSFPIPNALAPRITDQIKLYRKKQKSVPEGN